MSELDELARLQVKEASDLTEMGLLYRASQLAEAFAGRLPSVAELKDINRELGVEIATTVWLKSLLKAKGHGGFWRELQKQGAEPASCADYEVIIVASQLPLSGRRWGDHVEEWRQWARELGFATEVIETLPQSSVAENARFIRDYLTAFPHPRRIVVTYGQGTSEFRYYLSRVNEVTRLAKQERIYASERVSGVATGMEGVKAWISVCGAYAGASSSVWLGQGFWNKLRSFINMKFSGRHPKALTEMAPNCGYWRQPTPLPEGLMAVSLVGLPLRSQIPMGLHSSYSALAKESPNDGRVALYEACVPGSLYVPVAGMSHRAESRWLQPLFKRVLLVTLRALREREAARDRAGEPASAVLADLTLDLES